MNESVIIFNIGSTNGFSRGIRLANAVTTRQAESERKRERILQAARASFGRLGFAGATVETIASEAGVSNGLLYQFFRSKEHLFEIVLDQVVRDWARVLAAAEREPDPARALEVMFRSGFEFARDNRLLAALLSDDA